jgi:glycosyltransferase involved in cell wall biosynthesis
MPFFSVILATRDRPVLFAEALASVLAQQGADFELIVVDDGSTDESRAAYAPTLERAQAALGERLKRIAIGRRPNGHGQSYSLNVGADAAAGDHLAFLDDDDVWTDPAHLARAAAALRAHPGADLYMANQKAFRGGVPVDEALWLAPLAPALAKAGRNADADGVWTVRVDDLLANPGFCHVNCLVVRRALWGEIGGMDEAIRWECDRDLFLRLIDRAGTMLHHPAVVARHNVPDPSKAANMTTAIPVLEKRLHQLRVVDKAALFATHPAVRAHGRRHRAYVLKKMAGEIARAGDAAGAAAQARLALGAGPSLGWLGATARYSLRALGAGSRR